MKGLRFFVLHAFPNSGSKFRVSRAPYPSAACATALTVSGCGAGANVSKAGAPAYTTIQVALNDLAASLDADTCVVIRDTQTYSEQVTVQGFTTNGFRLKIMADPTFVSSAPTVNPPVASTAAFQIANDSVTLQGIMVITTNNSIRVNPRRIPREFR